MNEPRPLYIWSGDAPADLGPIKAAKAALGLDYRVIPTAVTEPPDTWEARILAVGSRPPWVCEYALTGEKTSQAGWERALAWVLREVEDDPKATTMVDVLSACMPADRPVREITAEELAAEQAMREYLAS